MKSGRLNQRFPNEETRKSGERNKPKEDNGLTEEKLDELINKYGKVVDDERTIFKDSDDNITIVDKSGEIYLSTKSGDFDTIYGYGEGFYTLWKTNSDFNKSGSILWVIDSSGNKLLHLDNQNYKYLKYYDLPDMNRTNLSSVDAFEETNIDQYYCGEGWIVFLKDITEYEFYDYFIECECFNCRTMEWKSIRTYDELKPAIVREVIRFGNERNLDSTFKERFLPNFKNSSYSTICLEPNVLSFLDSDLNEIHRIESGENRSTISVGVYSDGGLVYSINTSPKQVFFFDCESLVSVPIEIKDIEKLDMTYKSFKYINGKALIALEGADGNEYCAIIDKQGNYIKEPYLAKYDNEIEMFNKTNA